MDTENKTRHDLCREAEHIQPQATPEPAEQPYEADGQMDQEIVTIEKVTGAHLYDGDPELDMIVRDRGVRAFYQSVEKAVIAKRNRVDFPVDTPARDAWQKDLHKK